MKRQASALTFLTRYSEQGDDFLSHIVTGDETWMSHVTPELKQKSMEWRHTSSPIKKKFRQTISTCNIMCTVFWDRKAFMLVDFLHQGSTISAGVYCDTFKKPRHAIQNKQRGMLSQGVVMLHDNARTHTAATKQDPIAAVGWEQFDHPPPYSPDLAPSDFHVFLHLKTFLGNQRFHDEVKEVVNTWFASQAASFYEARIQKLVPRYAKCLNNGGNYVKKWRTVCTSNGNINGLEISCFLLQQPIRTYFLDNLRNSYINTIFLMKILH
jgi:histone-lysine N-methyltransferase SETMAR